MRTLGALSFFRPRAMSTIGARLRAKLTTDDGAEDSDGTEIIEDDASSPGVDRGAFGDMFALAQSVGADDAEVEDAASAAQDTGAFGSMFALAQAVGADDDDVEAAAEEAPPLPAVAAWSAPRRRS